MAMWKGEVVVLEATDDPDETLWGKSRGLDLGLPPYPLVRHLLDAAAMAVHLWDVYLSENQRRSIADGLGLSTERARVRDLVGLCAGLHDIGKVSGFQFCSRHGREYLGAPFRAERGSRDATSIGHDVAGMQAASEVLAVLGFDAVEGASSAGRVAQIIGGHHGRFFRDEGWRDDSFLGGSLWKRQRIAHASAVYRVLGRPETPETFGAPQAVLVTGVVILADWLVSQEHYLRRRQESLSPSLSEHFAESCADAAGLLADAGLVPVELSRTEFATAYEIVGEPNPLQRSVMEELPGAVGAGGRGGIALVTAAPGDGKTEAALEAERVLSEAFGTRGFAFLLPTMATSDQMFRRITTTLQSQAGERAGLTLVHSMAWLKEANEGEGVGAGPDVLTCDGDELGAARLRAEADMRPRRWLRGAKRALLAQFSVGTVDQALLAVLPARHNALRLLGLTGKTFIVDEAHAYDPYMQVLLGRVLNWLGAYGVPVILLSATLPTSVSDRLVREYLRGTGWNPRDLRGRTFPAPYPGWVYVDGESACATEISGPRSRAQAAERSMRLGVRVEEVVHGGGGERSRLAVIQRLVEPVAAFGGTALVVCNTVADAQTTYQALRDRFDVRTHREDGMVQLLHARFPADVREARTFKVTQGMGRGGPRPVHRIVVATQVVEQSLDLDADIVISDLAPMALLLQRAGRCWRHENWWARHGYPDGRGRPSWASAPLLVVLDPLAGGGKTPKHWGEIYSEFLLSVTSARLGDLGGGAVAIPGDVQDLVESVHGTAVESFDWDKASTRYRAAWSAHRGRETAERGMADLVAVCRARKVQGLHDLHSLPGEEDEWEVATRLGAAPVRLLCAYAHPDGRRTLDLKGQEPVPEPGPGERVPAAMVRAVMGCTIPVSSNWFKPEDRDSLAPPESWARHPMLGDLFVLYHPVRNEGGRNEAGAVTVGGKSLRLDEDLGLVRQ
ncbi:CRISPR-associated helicase Cas3' [Streptomyces sp. DW26H14]|uniref:CRISPR-associated helicase Cas3' n=1 Tax=Streptomyces sp. DW26H14 TaxID=3435395 RepID=UPI00403E0AE5